MTAELMNSLLRGAEAHIELSGLPPLRVSLDPAAAGKPSPLLRALRPRITLTQGGVELATLRPWGDPSVGPPWAALILGGAVLGLGALVWLALRR